VRSRADGAPDQYTPDTHDDISGWLWEGPFAVLIREAIPDITDADLRRTREYLNASGMVVNVRGNQTDAPPHWFIRSHWHQGQGGHVHVVTAARPSPPAAPPTVKPASAEQLEQPVLPPRQDIVAALQALAQQVSQLQADNERLRDDNDRLSGEVERMRTVMRQIGRAITRQAGQLLDDPGT
jgi:hypothetical protein